MKTRNDKAIATFLDQLDAIESSDRSEARGLTSKASSTLLEIKSIQRELFQKLQETNLAIEAKRQEFEKQSMLLSSLKYETAYLEGQLKKDTPTPHLERMCRDETENAADMTTRELMNSFLCGDAAVSYEDPSQYKKVLTKLHKEINLRGSLERDATQVQKELTESKKSLEQKQQFLSDLPKKLEQMERASLPLQRFFDNSVETDVSLAGMERKKRLDMARSLPGPLYTLFVQLQSHLDSSPEPDVSVAVTKKQVAPPANETEAWFQPDPHVVQLQLPLPEGAKDSRKTRVTIDFVYLPKLRIVTAEASGGTPEKVDIGTLLVNLFPGDEGKMIWSADNVHLQSDASTYMTGRPYHWCNYLAGVHLPAASANINQDPLSTKAVIKELMDRLQANSTLTSILSTLEKRKPNPIPIHPAWSDPSGSSDSPPTAKLIGWKETRGKGDPSNVNEKSFEATIRRKGSTMEATVTVDPSRYPSVPPRWSLTSGEESWGEKHGSTESLESGTNPLHDNGLGEIERAVNVKLEDLVAEDDNATCDWILAHQLSRIIQLWDDSQRAMEAGEGSRQTSRARKGRDRGSAT